VSLAVSVAGVLLKPIPTFYLLPTRGWELLAGSVLALGLVPRPNALWQREVGAAVGLLTIFVTVVLYTHDTEFPGLAALVPCVGAALVIWAGIGLRGDETWTGRLLATSVPVFIGLVSYSLYLWHWPLIVFAKHLTNGVLSPLLQLSLGLAALLFAFLSWRYVEKPLRAGGWPWPAQRHRFFGATFGLLAFLIVGAGLSFSHGLPWRFPTTVTELDEKENDFSELRRRCHVDGDGWASWTFERMCVIGASVPPSVVVFADSHGVELSKALGEAAETRNLSVRQLTASACPPAVGFVTEDRPKCAEYVDAMLHALSKAPPSSVVVAAHYFQWMHGSDRETLFRGFAETVQVLRKAGHSVILLGPVPEHPGGVTVPSALARWVLYGGAPADYRFALDRRAALDSEAFLRRIANETGSVYIPLVPYLCPDEGECRGYRNGTVMYFDDNHLSVSGARQVVSNFLAPVLWPERPSRP
jgi:hypothetical protein